MVVCDAVCAVRCICVEGAPAPGRKWGTGDGDGRKGDPGGEPKLSSLLQAGRLAGTRWGTEVPLGTAAPPVMGSLLVTAEEEEEGLMMGVRGPWEYGAQSTSPACPSPRTLMSVSCICACKHLPLGCFSSGPFPRGVLCPALPGQ